MKRKIFFYFIAAIIVSSLAFGSIYGIVSFVRDQQTTEPLPGPGLQTPQVIEGWTAGETVRADIEFNSQIAGYATRDTSCRNTGYLSDTIYDVAYSLADDAAYLAWYFDFTGSPTYADISIDYKIYCGGAGLLNTEWWTRFYGTVTGTGSTVNTDISVTADMLDAQGYLLLKGYVKPYAGANSYHSISYLDISTQSYVEIGKSNIATWTSASITYVRCYMDEFKFTRATIENQVRSYYQYSSAEILNHQLIIPSIPNAKEILIYAPVNYEFSSITPMATVTESSDDFIIESPTELTYTIFFTSRSDYFLGIEEITDSYFLNTGFENGECFLVPDYGNFPTSAEVKTDLSFEGSHSLYAIETGTYWYTFPEVLPSGSYYFNLWYYIETFGAGFFGLYWKDFNDAWNSVHVFDLDSETNRWQRFTFYFEQLGDITELMFKLSFSTETSFYIDSLEFFEATVNITTTESDYIFSPKIRSWDGYGNPVLPDEEIFIEIYDRTSQTLEYSLNTTTNSAGIATAQITASLEEKEYIINTYTFNNRFGDYATMDLGDTWDFNEGDYEGWSEKGTVTDKSITDGSYCYTTPATGGAGPWSGAVSFDSLEYTHIFIRLKVNDSYDLQFHDYPNLVGTETVDGTDFIVYTCYAFLDQDWTGILTGGLYLRDSASTEAHTNYLDWVLIAGEAFLSSFYFTPEYSHKVDYATTELSNAWDFSEGDQEDFTKANGQWETQNGYLLFDVLDSSTYMRIDSVQNIDFSEEKYTKAFVRFLINETDTDIRIRVKAQGGTDFSDDYYITLIDTWILCEFDISNWTDNAKLAVNIRYTNINLDLQFKIDFIRLVHEEAADLYESDNYLMLGSETDAWINAVYSDDIYLGSLAEPGLVAFNGTLGQHNITWFPYARQDQPGAYLSSLYYNYLYEYTIGANYFTVVNYPMIDVSAGKIYVDIESYWTNQTIRLKDNDTWLGSAVGEGGSVWSFTATPGFHNISICVYNGATLWDTILYSFTVNTDALESRITYLSVYGTKVDFDQFKTFVTITNGSRSAELNGYVDFAIDQNITIETYSYFDFILSNVTLGYNETLYVTLPIHISQFANYNITQTMAIRLDYSYLTYAGYMTITLGVGAISEPIIIYRDLNYTVTWSAVNHQTFTDDYTGYEIVKGTVLMSLTPIKETGLDSISIPALLSYIGVGVVAARFLYSLRPDRLKDKSKEEKNKERVWLTIKLLVFTLAIIGISAFLVFVFDATALIGIAAATIIILILSFIAGRKKDKAKLTNKDLNTKELI